MRRTFTTTKRKADIELQQQPNEPRPGSEPANQDVPTVRPLLSNDNYTSPMGSRLTSESRQRVPSAPKRQKSISVQAPIIR